MDKVDIIAKGSHMTAFPGNRDSVCICVCVTKADGTPVKDLQKTNFKVRQMAGGGAFSANKVDFILDISQSDTKFAGFYDLFVPIEKSPQIWAAGEYVFAVLVKSSTGTKPPFEGRTLAKLTIPMLPDK